jgi:hypothetical protein
VEHAATALHLRLAMPGMLAPARDRLLITPERERQYFAGLGKTLEALDRNETIDAREFLPSAAAISKYRSRRPSAGHTSKMTAIIMRAFFAYWAL